MTVHLPCVEGLLIVHMALGQQNVDRLEIIDVLVLLVSLADLCADSGGRNVGSVECYDFRCSSGGRSSVADIVEEGFPAGNPRMGVGYGLD